MPKFGNRSKSRLATCHDLLQRLFEEVVITFDCTILEGNRPEERQDLLFDQNRSKVKWPNSKHNKSPSMAIDVAPWFSKAPHVRWDKKYLPRYYYFAGYVKGIARVMDVPIRWGGDWDDDTILSDQDFNDLVHFELPTMK